MAGRVRHPIDVKALEAYLTKHVPEIQVPLDVKQVSFPPLPYVRPQLGTLTDRSFL